LLLIYLALNMLYYVYSIIKLVCPHDLALPTLDGRHANDGETTIPAWNDSRLASPSAILSAH